MANYIVQTQKQKQEFSVAMWIGKTALVLCLTIIIAVFYFDQFDLKQAIPYLGALLFIAGTSIAITKYHDSPNDRFKLAAFCCSVFLILLMAFNAAICFGVGRDMSVATQETESSNNRIKECEERIQGMMDKAGPRAKLELTKRLGDCRKGSEKIKSRQEIYGNSDSLLYWVMIVEFVSSALVWMLLIGLDTFKDRLAIASNSIHQDDIAAEIAVRRELAEQQRQEMIAAIRNGQMTNGSGQISSNAHRTIGEGMIDGRPNGQGPDIDPNTLAAGHKATGGEGDKWIVAKEGNKHVWKQVDQFPSDKATVRGNASNGHFRYEPASSVETQTIDASTQRRDASTQNGKEWTQRRDASTQNPMMTLREHLKVISSYHHGFSFKADERGQVVLIRMMRSVGKQAEKTEHSSKQNIKILDYVNQPDFRALLVKALRKDGFPLNEPDTY